SEGESPSLGTRGLVRVGQPAPPKAEEPKLYLLAIGINDYQDKKLALRFAVRDAQELAKSIDKHSKPIYRAPEIKILTDQDATQKGILEGLEWLKKARPEDVVVVFYAGHGDRDDTTGEFYLLPVDAITSRLGDTGVSGQALKRALADLQSRRVIVLLDACRSGSFAEKGGMAELARELKHPDYGVIVVCAAMAAEVALEDADLKHGYFTHALLHGLGGKGYPDDSGSIFMMPLYAFVEQQVMNHSKDRQHPTMARPSTIKPLALAKP